MRYIGRITPATTRAATAPLAGALALALAALLVLGPAAAGARAAGIAPQQPRPAPHLILLHGGSFLFHDPFFRPLTRPRAEAAGFVPHYVDYPLGNLGAAVTAARLEARRLRQLVGRERVYAYGSSAGGTLAAILAGEGDVEAAVAKAPVSDLAGWEWPLGRYGPVYYEAIAATPAALFRLSPLRRPVRRPLLVIQGRADPVVPLSMSELFAAKFERVRLWVVAGGHTTERVRPFLISRAMEWLAKIWDRRTSEPKILETLP